MSDDLPALTRWSFQDLQEAYDAGFIGRAAARKLHQQQQEEQEEQRPDPPSGQEDKPREAAIYERYLPQADAISDPSMKADRWRLKPPSHLFVGEMQELAESIIKDIVRGNPDVRWETVKGLDNAKRLLKEAVVMPIKYPQYFTGLLSPWKGILLFGPPGTGKTMLAKAVASECNTTFFNISASSIVSKYRGDSEKLVRVLFQLARYYAPSTIFLDEIDAIISQRGEAKSEHEASRRLKTELLIQMDGLMQTSDLVFLLAATNLPWELDGAMLRRLEKRILVPLPEPEARKAMFEELLPSSNGEQFPYDDMVAATEGYSGSDIRIVCKEAAMRPLRRLMAELENVEESSNKGQELATADMPVMGPITSEDVMIALKMTRPSAHLDSKKYDQFNSDFGSHAMS